MYRETEINDHFVAYRNVLLPVKLTYFHALAWISNMSFLNYTFLSGMLLIIVFVLISLLFSDTMRDVFVLLPPSQHLLNMLLFFILLLFEYRNLHRYFVHLPSLSSTCTNARCEPAKYKAFSHFSLIGTDSVSLIYI